MSKRLKSCVDTCSTARDTIALDSRVVKGCCVSILWTLIFDLRRKRKDNQDSGGEGMYKDRRKMTQGIVWVGANALIGHQDLIADVQRVLHQPSLGLGDKDLKDLEQKIRDY